MVGGIRKWPHDGPERAQDELKRPQDGPGVYSKCTAEILRWLQETSQARMIVIKRDLVASRWPNVSPWGGHGAFSGRDISDENVME